MPYSEETIQLIRNKAYHTALQSLEELILSTPTGAVREELTVVNITLMKCQDRQKQIDSHG